MDDNSTQFMGNPFGDVEEESLRKHKNELVYTILYYIAIITAIIKLILGMCAIAADILLIYFITKFKKLQSTVNIYIKHYAIFNITYFVSTALIHAIKEHSCLELQIPRASLLFNFLFAFALGFDWLIMTFNPELGQKVKNCYNNFTLSIYILNFAMFLVQFMFCVSKLTHANGYYLVLITYFSILLFILVLDYLNFRYKSSITSTKIVYSLTVANIIILCWLPMVTYHILYIHKEVIELIFWFLEFIPEWMSTSVSIVIIVVLVKKDKHFSMAFAKVFKKSARQYSNDDENLDESEHVTTHSEIDPNVFYNNATTCVKI